MNVFDKNVRNLIAEYSSDILEEIFDYVPENIEKNVIDKDDVLNVEYTFKINEKEYQVDFLLKKKDKSVKFSFALISELSNQNVSPLGLTGTGDSHLVFGSVANIFKKFIEEYSSRFEKLLFIGSKRDKNRVRLYDRFVKNSWITSNFSVDIRDENDVRFYTLTKKNHDNTENI